MPGQDLRIVEGASTTRASVIGACLDLSQRPAGQHSARHETPRGSREGDQRRQHRAAGAM